MSHRACSSECAHTSVLLSFTPPPDMATETSKQHNKAKPNTNPTMSSRCKNAQWGPPSTLIGSLDNRAPQKMRAIRSLLWGPDGFDDDASCGLLQLLSRRIVRTATVADRSIDPATLSTAAPSTSATAQCFSNGSAKPAATAVRASKDFPIAGNFDQRNKFSPRQLQHCGCSTALLATLNADS